MRWLIFLTPILMAAGCTRDPAPASKVKPEDVIRVMGAAKPPAPREHPAPTAEEAASAFAGQVFEAEATAPERGVLNDSAERRVVARAEARRAALRVLAVKALTQPVTPETSLGDWVRRAEGWPERFSEILEKNALVSFEDGDGETKAKARLPGEAVSGGFDFTELAALEAASAAPVSSPQSRERLQAEATEDARAKLREILLDLDTPKGKLRDAIRAEDAIRGRFDVLVGSAPPSSVDFGDDGSCRVAIEFNRERARSIAAP